MILGCYGSDISREETQLHLARLSTLMTGNLMEFHSLNEKNFLGGIIHNNISLNIKDFTYRAPNQDFVLFSGQIYNSNDLHYELNLTSNPVSVPEMVYKLFQKNGNGFADKLNGDFTIAILRPLSNSLLLYRDHVGVRPLSYHLSNSTLYFSSDMVSLGRVFHNNDDNINSEPLMKDFKFIDNSQTYNNKVKKILPGHYIEFENGVIKVHKYWLPERIKTDNSLQRKTMLKDVNSLIENAVEIRCDPLYHTAAHMSGGIDSGIVAALAKKTCSQQQDFIGYSWSPQKHDLEKIEFDETKLVNDQAKLNDITPVFITSSIENYKYLNSNRLNNSEFIQENLVLADAKERNIQVILSGHGGDEFISKGDRGLDTDLLFSMLFRQFFHKNPLTKPKRFFKKLIYEIFMPAIGIIPGPVIKDSRKDTQYLRKEFQQEYYPNMKKFFTYRSRRQLHLGFLYCYYLPDRMEEWYVNGLRHGIEYRYPLLDKNIVEYMLKVPSKLLVNDQWSRTILREISDGLLPDSIRWRTSGMDPVSFYAAQQNVYTCGKEYMNEIDEISMNQDLDFFDFEKIKTDIDKYRKDPDDEKYTYLLYNLFNIKGLHEFTKAYRQKPGEET